jgi:raffinose/stachyose/melibiose transport system permease protein
LEERLKTGRKSPALKNSSAGIWGNARSLALWFSAPAILVYSLFMILPIVVSLYISLQKWDGANAMIFVGLGNFITLLTDGEFWVTFKNTMVLLVMSVGIQVPIGFLLAYLLYRTPRYMGVFRAIYFMPAAIAATVIGVMFSLLLNADLGPLNYILKNVGLRSLAMNWLSDKHTVLLVTCTVMIWQYIGYHTVIILAGMQSIPVELIEAAAIDGASSRRILFRIVLPLCKDMLQICFILAVVGSFKSFDIPYIMTWGGPGMASTFLAVYMFKVSFLKSSIGMGTAVGIIILLLALVGTRVVNRVFYGKDADSVT